VASADHIIEDAKFNTCRLRLGEIASIFSLCNDMGQGQDIDEALCDQNTDIVKELALPAGEYFTAGAFRGCDPIRGSRLEESRETANRGGCRAAQ